MNIVWIFVFAFILLKIPKYSAKERKPIMLPCKLEKYHMTTHPCKWPGGIVPYVIKYFSNSQIRRIQTFIDNWNRLIPEVQFVPFVPSPLSNMSREEDHVAFISANGCWSYIGRIGVGEQPISLQRDGCLCESIAHHEMMHAIGFVHEQTRYNRDEYVKILWDNIPEDWKGQFEKNPNARTIFFPNYLGPYDYYSITHYDIQLFGETVMEILKDADIRRINDFSHKNISSLDIMKIRKFYQDENFQNC